MNLVDTLREELKPETFLALARAIEARKQAAEAAGYARAMAERSTTLMVADTLRGLAKSWTAWASALLIAMPEILPMIQGDLPELLGQNAANRVMQACGVLMLLLRLKTTTSLHDKGADAKGEP
jgi:predicted nucleic acid-binding Zn ribbon protein